jgi:hypothetical protein
MVQVDLRAPTIPPQTRVWRLFPGEGYQFLSAFQEQRIGFLDFPDLQLPEGNLIAAPNLAARFLRSLAIRDLLKTMRRDGANLAAVQSENFAGIGLDQFTRARTTQNRGRLQSAIVNFYQEANMNDYIILPEPVYMSKVWVGRVTTDTVVSGYASRRYGQVPIPSRTIDWISSFPENMISGELSRSLRHQHPFTLLQRGLHLEVFSLVHGSFVFGDRHVSTIFNDLGDFLDTDAAFLGTVSRLAAAACRSIDLDTADFTTDELIDILLQNPPIEYTCSQATDIHSAGFNRYASGTIVALVIAAVVAALIAFGNTGTKETLETEAPQLQVINTSPDADPQCTARVSEATKRVLHVLGTDKTWDLCGVARASHHRAGMRSSAPTHH